MATMTLLQSNMTHQTNIQPKLDHFRKNLLAMLQPARDVASDRSETLDKVIQRLSRHKEGVAQDKTANPLCDVLQQLTKTIHKVPQRCQNIVTSIIDLQDDLPWYQRPVANNPEFMAGHVNAQIIGPEGLEVRQDLIVGVTLMRPHLYYPDHQHEPEELYLVLSDGRWRQACGDWHTPGLGGLVYNPSDVMHGMKSLATPLIALWCLPLDKPFKPFSVAIKT